MRTTITAAAFCGLFAATAVAAPGMAPFATDGARPLSGHVLYPGHGGAATEFAGNPVWRKTAVAEGAAPAEGPRPLVILSHGMFGNRFNQAWLAARLAEAGHIVVGFDHPGTSTWDRDPAISGRLWERAGDLSHVLDAMLADPDWGPRIDRARVFAIGHSLGGWTVAALAGGRGDLAAMNARCAAPGAASACGPLRVLRVGEGPDAALIEGDMSDDRFAGFVALDPGGFGVFDPATLANPVAPLMVVSAGRTPDLLDPAAEAFPLAEATGARHEHMAEAGHFDFLGLCTAAGPHILAEEAPEDAVLCAEGPTPRDDLHARTAAAILDFFAATAK